MRPSSSRVAARHLIRVAARNACRATFRTRTASVDLTERVFVAGLEGALIPDDGSPVRTAGLMALPRKSSQEIVDRQASRGQGRPPRIAWLARRYLAMRGRCRVE